MRRKRRLKTFSKGMRQKTGLTIAILRNAPAMLLDEPRPGNCPSCCANCGTRARRF